MGGPVGAAGRQPAEQMRTRFESEPGTGDILVQQEGRLTTNGLVGVSWGIASVPDQVEVLVPGCSGQRFGADAPAQRRTFDYPMMWEAPFVLIQGQRGGVIIWADDPSYRFKSLVLDHSQRVVPAAVREPEHRAVRGQVGDRLQPLAHPGLCGQLAGRRGHLPAVGEGALRPGAPGQKGPGVGARRSGSW